MNVKQIIPLLAISLSSGGAFASAVDNCMSEGVKNAGEETTVLEIKENCERLADGEVEVPQRLIQESNTKNQAFVITPHRQNYILPYSYVKDPNQTPWENQDSYPGIDEPVDNDEAKLQLSLKVPLTPAGDIFTENDELYFGFTLKSFWQVYNDEISAPFRETNYRPEIFYEVPFSSRTLGGTILTRVGFEHESNGRSQHLSRSWNRVYAMVGFFKNNWGVAIQPWYRIPEDDKDVQGDPVNNIPPSPEGDDNPDIEDYMGHYELSGVYSHKNLEFTGRTRYNFEEGNGAIEVGMSFPLWGRLKGYVQYFNGYGESLIDYNHQVERIGIGFLLTDIL